MIYDYVIYMHNVTYNVLQYKENEQKLILSKFSDSFTQRQGKARSKSLLPGAACLTEAPLSTLCSAIPGDAPLYTLFRVQTQPIRFSRRLIDLPVNIYFMTKIIFFSPQLYLHFYKYHTNHHHNRCYHRHYLHHSYHHITAIIVLTNKTRCKALILEITIDYSSSGAPCKAQRGSLMTLVEALAPLPCQIQSLAPWTQGEAQ